MRTTLEMPDSVLTRAKSEAALAGVSLKEFFIEAVEMRLAANSKKSRRVPPRIGSEDGPRIGLLTADQVDEAVFG
jgi:hypothetical protein